MDDDILADFPSLDGRKIFTWVPLCLGLEHEMIILSSHELSNTL